MKLKKTKIFYSVLAGVIIAAALFFYMALFKGFYASSDKPIGAYSGPAPLFPGHTRIPPFEKDGTAV